MDVSPRLRAGLRALRGAHWACRCSHTRLHIGLRAGLARARRLLPGLGLLRRERGRRSRCASCAAVAVREERAAWLVMGFGLVGLGGRRHHVDAVPTPTTRTRRTRRCPTCSTSPSIRPATSRCSCWRARARDSFRSSLWLDGAIAGLTVAALIATLAFQPIVDATSGSRHRDRGEPRLSGRRPAAAGPRRGGLRPERLAPGPGLAAPGRRPCAERGRRRHLPGPDARRTPYVQGTLLDPAWPASVFLVAVAAWQPARRKITIQDWVIMAVPVGCGLVAVAAARVRPLRAREHRRR